MKRKTAPLHAAAVIFRMNLGGVLRSPRVLLLLAMAVLYPYLTSQGMLELSRSMGKPLNLLEPYAALLSNPTLHITILAGGIFLLSDLPITRENQSMLLVRASRRAWLAAQVLYALVLIALYLFVLFAGCALSVLLESRLTSDWSTPVITAAISGAAGQYFWVPEEAVLQLTPFTAALWGTGLLILELSFLGLLFLSLKLQNREHLALALVLGIVAVGWVTTTTPYVLYPFNILQWFSPLNHGYLLAHDLGYGGRPEIWHSVAYFAALLALELAGAAVWVQKYDFSRETAGVTQ